MPKSVKKPTKRATKATSAEAAKARKPKRAPRRLQTPIQPTSFRAEGNEGGPPVDGLAERHAQESLHKVLQPLIEELMTGAQGSEARFNSTIIGLHTVLSAHLGRIEHFMIHRFNRWDVESFRLDAFEKGKGSIPCAHVKQVLALSQGKISVQDVAASAAASTQESPGSMLADAVIRVISGLAGEPSPDPTKGKPDTN